MSALKNQRWEAFAQGLAKGLSGDQAYQDAGYKPNRHNAARLKPNEHIQARVAELREKVVEKSSIDQAWVIDTLVENVKRSMQAVEVLDTEGTPTGEYRYEGTVANRGLELIGKHLGLFVEKISLNVTGNLPHSLDEMLAAIERERKERANGHAIH